MSVRNHGGGSSLDTLVLVVLVAVMVGVATGLNADGAALLAFKKAIWSDPQGAFRSWNSADATPCLWNGITCVGNRVVSMDLSRRALGGTIAPSLGELGHLATVNLSQNEFMGSIPSMGQQLQVLELSGNRLTGALPQDIVACPRLTTLLLSHNRIAGVIPVGMGALQALERLDLSVNELSGSIPNDFGNLTSLLPQAPLNLSNNGLTGAIPATLANLERVPIDLSNNKLSGSVPSDSYFQSQGPVAYIGNAALCGAPLKIDCTPSPSDSESNTSNTSTSTTTAIINSEEPALRRAAVVAIAVGSCIAGLMFLASAILYCTNTLARKSMITRECFQGGGDSSCLRVETDADEDDEDEVDSLVQLSGVFSFDLEELLRASAYVLGKSSTSGAKGIVYKAVLDVEGTPVVAVRRLGDGGEQKRKEFENCLVKSVAPVTRHPHVVSLHSFSWTPDEKLLVFDFLPNGSLETALHGRPKGSKGTLTWNSRVRIACGAAQGIAHIHEWKLIHGDIKPGNILLDVFMEAQIADLGLQRLLSLMEHEHNNNSKESMVDVASRSDSGRSASAVSPTPEYKTWSWTSTSPSSYSTTMGEMYQAPDAIAMTAMTKQYHRLTQKSDVYSFGVVLLELLTGRSQFKQMAAGELDLIAWLRFALRQKNSLYEIFDPVLLIDVDEDCQTKMIETLQVALACVAINPDSRPKMKQVAEYFEQIYTTS